MIIRPHPGMQVRMMASPAEVVLAGARAGVGKSFGMCLCPTMFHARQCDAVATIFRRRTSDIDVAKGIFRDARKIYRPLGAHMRRPPSADFHWVYPNGNELDVKFGALPERGDEEQHQGDAYSMLGWDELTHWAGRPEQVTFLMGRMRSPKEVPYKPFIRATLNPISHGWIRDLVDWWVGEDGLPIPARESVIRWFIRAPDDWPTLFFVGSREEADENVIRWYPKRRPRPMSITLIPGRPEDNPSIDHDEYADKLSMMEPWIRESWLGGNWNVERPDAAKIWRLPPEAIFEDDDDDFQAALHGGKMDLYGGWDYGRAKHGLAWICGALQPGSPPTLWIIGCRVWSGTSAEEAADDRAAFLEHLDLPLQVGDVQDAGDPAGFAKILSELSWVRLLRARGVPLVNLQHLYGEEKSKIYWNSREGFVLTTEAVQAWLNSGRLRIRRHPSTEPLMTAIQQWSLRVPEGASVIDEDIEHLRPRKDKYSHLGDALRYEVAFVSAMVQIDNAADLAPASDVIAYAEAARAAQLMGSRPRVAL